MIKAKDPYRSLGWVAMLTLVRCNIVPAATTLTTDDGDQVAMKTFDATNVIIDSSHDEDG